MHAFLIPHSLDQLQMRHWIGHILNVVLLTFILTLQSSSLHLIKNILSFSLQNLFLSIASDDEMIVSYLLLFTIL
jgi:hypothetical protein